MSSAAALFDMRISGSRRASAAMAGSSEGKTLSVTAMTGRATGALRNSNSIFALSHFRTENRMPPPASPIHPPGPARAPADPARMATETRMLQPDFVRHRGGLQMQRAGLQQLESGIGERPLDLNRHTHEVCGVAQQAPERHCLAGIE